MLLSVDIGNSSVKFGIYDVSDISYNNLICKFKISSVAERSSDEYEVIIRSLLLSKCADVKITRSVICSVVPSLTHVIYDALYAICGTAPFIIGTGTKTGFKIKTDNPSELGADMVCNTAAAVEIFEAPVIVVDMGTATTITYINENKEIEGSVIIPGVAVSLNALTDSAELLSKFSLKKPSSLIGKNTADSIMSGVFYSNLFTINSYIEQIMNKTGAESANLVATGGISPHIIPYCEKKFKIIDDLTIYGAAVLYFKNRGTK